MTVVSDGDDGRSGSILSLLSVIIRATVVIDDYNILCLWTWQSVFFIHNCITIFIIFLVYFFLFLVYFNNHVRIFFN